MCNDLLTTIMCWNLLQRACNTTPCILIVTHAPPCAAAGYQRQDTMGLCLHSVLPAVLIRISCASINDKKGEELD